MDSIGVIFAMLIAILASGVIVRVLPFSIPLPLIQISLGFIISAVFNDGVTLSPNVFFLLFLPPLLFLDGWRIPKDLLHKERLGIFQLAFGLVFITVFGLGYVIHWMIPAMPLSVSFALAAIVSPTDPIAVAGIARRLAVPERIMSVLEGEALFNDASGLVAFRMAVLATMTGTFSFYHAATSLLWVSFAGILTGVIVTWGLSSLRTRFTQSYGEELGSEILLNLLTPFAAYVLAEHFQASGILAAVAAGLTMSYLELSGSASAMTRMRRNAIWDTVQFTLNGMMFVLLGEQLPAIFTNAVKIVEQTGHHNPWWLAIYALVICLVLTSLRFIWVFISSHLSQLLQKNKKPIYVRDLFVLSLGGVRGAVTLAGVLTLPLLLPNQEQFPARDLAIFLAAAVIIISLITASISLPLLLRNAQTESPASSSFTKQKQFAIQTAKIAATKHLASLSPELQQRAAAIKPGFYEELRDYLLAEFESNFATLDDTDQALHQQHVIERTMRLTIIRAARQSIYGLARDHKISDQVARQLVKQLDYDEIRFD